MDPWARELLAASVPTESKATCHQCVMTPPDGAATAPTSGVWFTPEVRCCTYEPALPNYLVGRVLRDDAPDRAVGRRSMEARLAHLESVTPWGVRHSGRFLSLYGAGSNVFGRAPALQCPHLLPDGAGCGIWHHRNAVCATWHCKHERGALGAALWNALRVAASEVEQLLGLWCARQLGVPDAAVIEALETQPRPLRAGELGGPHDTDAYAALWGNWRGREAEFYRACAALVDPLTWADVERIGGERLAARVALVRTARAALEAPLPDALTLASVTLRMDPHRGAALVTYSGYDPLVASNELVQILPRFRGAPTADTLATIEAHDGVRVSAPLLQRLVDFGVLAAGRSA